MSGRLKISEEDFSAWKDAPVTQAFIECLKSKISDANAVWINTMHDARASAEDVERLRIELRAKLEIIEDFIELKLEDIQDNDTGVTDVQPPKRRSNTSRAA